MTGLATQTSFIEEYFLSEDLCNQLIEFFESRPDLQHSGCIGRDNVDETRKFSTDMLLDDGEEFFYRYFAELAPLVRDYCDKYKINVLVEPMAYLEPTNIQRYLPNQGYFIDHYERASVNENTTCRELVFMTYLNTIQDFSEHQGATAFPFQHYFARPVVGKTLIWPAGFTHRHYGIAHKTEKKYIVTGWRHLRR